MKSEQEQPLVARQNDHPTRPKSLIQFPGSPRLKAEQLTFLKGEPAFWGRIETKLYSLEDEPDLPPEKKKKIVDALHELSIKYKPYVDALSGDDAPAPAKGR